MPSFKVSNLPEKTRVMHETQTKWRKKNWEDTLKNHSNDLENLISLIGLFDIWKNRLPRKDVTRSLSREIYTDAYFSIHLACFGLYKNAYMSLRSQFETAMRLIYFSNHPVEYKLWQSGDEKWMGDLLKGSDVWGQSFKYFIYIPEISELEERISHKDNLWLTKGDSPKLREIYGKLSKHVHSVGPYLQTRSGRLSTKYNQNEFETWYEMFSDVQKYISILFALCFAEKFKNMPTHEREQILDLAIGSDYKDLVKRVCGL
jgi:hypothetical protein